MFSSALRNRALLSTGGSLIAGSAALCRQRHDRHLRAEQSGNDRYLVQKALTSVSKNLRYEEWGISSKDVGCTGPKWSVEKTRLHGGRQEATEQITVDNGLLKFSVVVQRGMSISKLSLLDDKGEVPLGWSSPVKETVHPRHMELNDKSGLGWLTGFNEWMVRCGVAFAGHPGKDGDHLLTLHGRIGNIPASEVEVLVDKAPPHRIRVRGRVDESMFKFCDFELWTEVSTVPGSDKIHIDDVLINRADYHKEFQMIYHTNFGPGSDFAPFLQEGASFIAPIEKVAPFNAGAAKEMDWWDRYLGPTRNYGETVYCITPFANASGRTQVAMINAKGDRGVALTYLTANLPAFTLWKNTDTLKEGYVTGLEPGTGFCYPRHIERAAGRVPSLEPGGEVRFELVWRVLKDAEAVKETKKEIETIQRGRKSAVFRTPTFHDPRPFYEAPQNI